jgi:RimJ/RimL family protein N-acetyltransferase
VTRPSGSAECETRLANSRQNRTTALVVGGIAGIWALLTVATRSRRGRASGDGDINTARLVMRPARPDDADAVHDTIDDVVIAANGWPPHVPELIHRAILHGAPPGQLAIMERTSGRIVGQLEYLRPNGGALATIGFWTARDARRKGYMREAVVAVATHLHLDGVTYVRALTSIGNSAVAQVLHQAGFVQLPVHPDAPTILEFVHRSTPWHPFAVPVLSTA